MDIGFIGNFSVPYSTESDRKWTFLKLGHNVFKFQEDKTSKEDLYSHIGHLDMLFYSHTHGWEIQGLKEVFRDFKTMGIPTVSVHLDRWSWLEREKDVGQEATWFTEYQFMADFSPEAQELYKKVGLKKVFYLKPGVVERDCYVAGKDPVRFPHEIVFIGSKNYHPEYPFRKELVEWLHKTYGSRFGHYGNDGLGVIREHDLNVLCSTAKIVVGDTCFGGRPNYVSDRYYETRGRGGFLLHPFTEGVDYEGVGFYEKENLESLKFAIDSFLQDEETRESLRLDGFDHVKNNETYTDRALEMISVISNQ